MSWQTPTLRYAVACEEFRRFGQKTFSLVNVLLHFPPPQPYPFVVERIDVVAVVTDGLGTFDFGLEFARVDHSGPTERVAFIEAREQELTDPAHAYTLPFFWEQVPIESPGDYEFRLFVLPVRNARGEPIPKTTPTELGSAMMRMELRT